MSGIKLNSLSGSITLSAEDGAGNINAEIPRAGWATAAALTAVENAQLGQQTIWMPAGAMTPRETSGAESVVREFVTNDINLTTLNFDTATDEFAHFAIQMPKSWNEGTIIAQAVWTAASGTGTVAWGVGGKAHSDSGAIDAAITGSVVTTDTLITANDVHIGPESTAITISGTPAAEDLVIFQVFRDVSADTLAVDAELIGIKIHYTTDAPTDT